MQKNNWQRFDHSLVSMGGAFLCLASRMTNTVMESYSSTGIVATRYYYVVALHQCPSSLLQGAP